MNAVRCVYDPAFDEAVDNAKRTIINNEASRGERMDASRDEMNTKNQQYETMMSDHKGYQVDNGGQMMVEVVVW